MLLLFVSLTVIVSLVTCDSGQPVVSNYASEFSVGFPRLYSTSDRLEMMIITKSSTPVSFNITSLNGHIYNGTTISGAPTNVTLPSNLQVRDTSYTYRQLGVRITSPLDQPISVILTSYVSAVSAYVSAYLALPCYEQPVQEYVYYGISQDEPNSASFYSQILIVGCRDNATITITPSQNVQLPSDTQNLNSPLISISSGSTHTVTLHSLQTLLISVNRLDLSGTKIISNHPLTVVGGHDCVRIPATYDNCNPITTQVSPTINWGTQYMFTPLRNRTNGQRIKFISSENNTNITVKCPNFSLNNHSLSTAGSVYHVDITTMVQQQYCSCVCTKPCLVSQFAFGGDFPIRHEYGAPVLMTIPSVNQYPHSVTFTTLPDTSAIFYSVVVPADSYYNSMLLINGTLVIPSWTLINNAVGTVIGYGYTGIAYGVTTISHSHPNGKIYVNSYGFQNFAGFGNLAGTNLDPLLYMSFTSYNSNFNVNEHSGNVHVWISRSNRLSSTITVIVRTTNSTISPAIEYMDYIPINQTVTFLPEEEYKNVSIPILEDNLTEETEHFIVNLEVYVNGQVYQVDQTQVSIDDNDVVMFGFKETSLTVVNEETVSAGVVLLSGTLQIGLTTVLALEIRGSNGNVANVSMLFFQHGVSEVAIVFNATQLSLSFNLDARLIVNEKLSSNVRLMLNPNQTFIQHNPIAITTSSVTIPSYLLATIISTVNSMTPLTVLSSGSSLSTTSLSFSFSSPTVTPTVSPTVSSICIPITGTSSAASIGIHLLNIIISITLAVILVKYC